MKFYDPRHTPDSSGTLHEWSNETANCGMGAIANLKGEKSYDIIDYALTSVCNMTHRGAVDADMKTGDGSGVLCQIPHALFSKAAAKFGYSGEASDLGVGVFFLPEGSAALLTSMPTTSSASSSSSAARSSANSPKKPPSTSPPFPADSSATKASPCPPPCAHFTATCKTPTSKLASHFITSVSPPTPSPLGLSDNPSA